MPDENGTETTRSDAAVAEESSPDEETSRESQGGDDSVKTADADAQSDATEELKVIVSIKEGRATVGVQQPYSDPHIEAFEDADLTGLALEVIAVTQRAKVRWEETPKHPPYDRPTPPIRRRSRNQQGTTQQEEQEPRLF
ncbi:MAG: hypothetical protein F4169_05270 [Gammaproteobacteria bacterium]|nr:hypothetical protein [Chloroflexota bacterium]MYF28262.1 hypothetical protein [Gammaproteobacteria bacterium]MYK62472.1 hypothetical protein [Chloroflexota bacterium]